MIFILFPTIIDGKIKQIPREKKVATQIIVHNPKALTSPVITTQAERYGTRSKVLSLLLPWLYFMAVSINIPNFPKFVNLSMNKGDPNVSPKSAAIYGIMSGTDAFFTFLSVNLVGCMSDSFGRRPFMILSSLGLGMGYFLALSATTPSMFYFGSMIDGLTSCMFSQAQSYIADINSEGNGKQSVAVMLGRFQGIAVGFAFMFGIPLGGILGAKFSPKFTLFVSIGICIFNAILIALFLPESVPYTGLTDPKRKKIKWVDASPAGAAKMLTRNRKLFMGTLAYFLFNLAQAGVQINWINYLQFRFGWSAAKSGLTMVGVGVTVAFLPQIFIQTFGKMAAISFGLLLHAVSIIALGTAQSPLAVYIAMAFFSAGACTMPIILGFLTEEVSSDEVGALQGSADTVRTISTFIGAPLMAKVFGYYITSEGGKTPYPQGVLYVASLFSFAAFAVFTLGCPTDKIEKKIT